MAKRPTNFNKVQSAVLATAKSAYSTGWAVISEFFENTITPTREALRYSRKDDEVKAATTLLWDVVFGQGLKVVPAVPENDPEYKDALDIAKFIEKQGIANLDLPFIHYLRDFNDDAFHEGTSFAKMNARYLEVEGEAIPKIVLDSFTQYELDEVSVIEDEEGNAVAIYTADVSRIARNNYNKGVPIEAFVITTHERRKKGIYGISQLAAAVYHVCAKVKTYLKWETFLSTCAMPKTYAILEVLQGQEFVLDGNNQRIPDTSDPTGSKTVVGVVNEAMSDLQNRTNFTLTHGTNHATEVGQLEVKGEGKAFENAITMHDIAIRKSLLLQTRATGEGTDGSGGTNATSESQTEILSKRIIQLRFNCEETIRRSVYKVLTVLNFGEDKAHLTPKLDLGEVPDRQLIAKMAAYAGVGYSLDLPTHAGDIDEDLGFKRRPANWQEKDLERKVDETTKMTKASTVPNQGVTK